MTSSQLAGILGKEKKHVNEGLRLMFPEEIEGNKFRPTLRANGQVDEYYVPEAESVMYVATKDINYLRQITKYWINRHQPAQINQPLIGDFANIMLGLESTSRLLNLSNSSILGLVSETHNGTI